MCLAIRNYNGRGDLTKITNGSNITNYTYDAADQLTNVTATGVNATYVYNADGKRVKQTLGSTVTNYLWDEASAYGDVVYEYSNTGSALANYVLAGTQLISQTRGSTTKYFLQDGQGSTRGLLSNVANPTINDITDTYSYTAFGESFATTGTTVNPYRYTGQQLDTSTGLYDLRARYYNPALGRFLSRDTYPVNFNNPVELNRYTYTANNPINAIDPSGQDATENALITKFIAFGVAVGALGETASLYLARGGWTIVSYLPQLLSLSTDQVFDLVSAGQYVLQPAYNSAVDYVSQLQTQTEQADEPRFVRVRHYSRYIENIKAEMMINVNDSSGPYIWVEYPIITPYEEKAIQSTTASFYRPLNKKGGFVEFNVDLEKWRVESDPNLPYAENSKIIWMYQIDSGIIVSGFSLYEPGVNPIFFDWKGNPLK